MPFLIDHLLLEPIMKTIRKSLLASCLALGLTLGGTSFASADVRIHLSFFPNLVPVPGYPVYYAPGVEANFFFYDGMYWLYDDDGWYMSNWYDGPWEYVDPDDVPLFVLRVPLRYYRAPPAYFWGGYRDAPPRWGHYWGPGWESNHRDWDRWDRRRVPPPAPLPVYQRGYPRDRYPDRNEQREIHERNYPNHSNYGGGERSNDRDRDRGDDRRNDRDGDNGRNRSGNSGDSRGENRDGGWQRQPERDRHSQEINQPPLSPREFNGGNNFGGQRGDEHRSNWGEGQQPRREQPPQQQPQEQPHEREVMQPRYSAPRDRDIRPQPQLQQRPEPAREESRGGWQQQRQPEPQRVEPQQSVPGRGHSEMQGRGAEQQSHGRGFNRGDGQ
jgi:hypothetical protein